MDNAASGYRPLHVLVRALERDARRIDTRIDAQNVIIERSGPNGIYSSERGERAIKHMAQLQQERDALLAQIPPDWKARHAAFSKIQKQENVARLKFRRASDQAYEPLQEILAELRSTDDLARLEDELRALDPKLSSLSAQDYVTYVEDVRALVGDVEGTSDIRSGLSKVRKAMHSRTPDPEQARKEIATTLNAFSTEVAWREKAREQLLPKLERYEAAIHDTIGLRSQPRLSREQALYVASCLSDHRDVSLSF